jgi:Ni,Fe-hydrogenase III large subunit
MKSMGLTSTGTQKDVRMTDETLYPIEPMADDSTLNKITKNLGKVAERVKEVLSSVVSISEEA